MIQRIILLLLLPFAGIAQTLDLYIREAYENHPGILAERERLVATGAKIDEVGGLKDPSLTASYAVSPIETRVGPQIARFSIMQPLPWFGTLNSRSRSEYWKWRSANQSLIEMEARVELEVRSSYHRLQEWHLLDALLKENISILEDLEAIATQRFESGDGSMLDVLRIQMEKEEIKNQWENWQDRGGNLRESFNLLIGRDQGSSILLDSLVPPSPSTFKDSIDLSNHPEVNKWELESRASAEALRAAKKDGAPSFAVGLDYVVIGERMDMDIPDNGKDAIMPMLSLSLPLWRKQYEGRETEAQQMAQFNLRKKEDALRILRSRESEILSNLEVYSREVSLYKGLMEKAQVALNLGMKSYSTGELAFEELMRIEQQWIRYREGWIKALVQWNIAEAEWRFLSTQSTIEDE